MESSCTRFTAAEGGARLAASAGSRNVLVTEHTAFISTSVLTEHAYKIRGPLSSGWQRSMYITRASRIDCVAHELSILTDLTVVKALRFEDIDDWRQELEEKQVLVCTSGVLQRILSERILDIPSINILVIDSCHLIFRDENLQYIMQLYKQCDGAKPRILALTYPLFTAPKDIEKDKINKENEISKEKDTKDENCDREDTKDEIDEGIDVKGNICDDEIDSKDSLNNEKRLGIRKDFEESDSKEVVKQMHRTKDGLNDSKTDVEIDLNDVKGKGDNDEKRTDLGNVDDFDLYEKLEWKIEELESALCCEMDLAEDIDGGKRLLATLAKPKELIIEYNPKLPAEALSEPYVDLEVYMRNTVTAALDFINEHRYDPTEIYGEDMYEEFANIPDPTVEPKNILKEFLYVLDQLGPYAADKAAFSLLIKLEKLKIKVPYERHFLLLCLCTSVFVKIRCYTDMIFSKYTSDWEKITAFSTPKVLRLAEILEQFQPPESVKGGDPKHILNSVKNENDSIVDVNKLENKNNHGNIDTNGTDNPSSDVNIADNTVNNIEKTNTNDLVTNIADTENDNSNKGMKRSKTNELLSEIEKCDFASLGNKIEDRVNTYEANLKDLDSFEFDADVKVNKASSEKANICSKREENTDVEKNDIKNNANDARDEESGIKFDNVNKMDSVVAFSVNNSFDIDIEDKLDHANENSVIDKTKNNTETEINNVRKIECANNNSEDTIDSVNKDSVAIDIDHKHFEIDSVHTDGVTIDNSSKSGLIIDSGNKDGVTLDSVSKDGVTIDSVHKDGVTLDSVNQDGVAVDSVHKDGVTIDSVHKDGVAIDSVHKDGVTLDSVSKDGVTIDSVHKDGVTLDSVNKDCVVIDSVHKDGVTLGSVNKDGVAIDSVPSNEGSKLNKRSGHRTRGRGRVQRGNASKMQQMQQNPDALCGIVFVKDALMAKIMFMIIVDMSRSRPSLSHLCAQYCATEAQGADCQKEGKKQEEVLKKFRMHECNLLLATSVLEEGIDLPRCNLVVRWDVPPSYRSHGLCRGRARAPRAAVALLASCEAHSEALLYNLAVYKELDQIITRKCGCGIQYEPPLEEENHADSVAFIVKPYSPAACTNNNGYNDIKHEKISISDEIAVENEEIREKLKENNKDVDGNDQNIRENEEDSMVHDKTEAQDKIVDRYADFDEINKEINCMHVSNDDTDGLEGKMCNKMTATSNIKINFCDKAFDKVKTDTLVKDYSSIDNEILEKVSNEPQNENMAAIVNKLSDDVVNILHKETTTKDFNPKQNKFHDDILQNHICLNNEDEAIRHESYNEIIDELQDNCNEMTLKQTVNILQNYDEIKQSVNDENIEKCTMEIDSPLTVENRDKTVYRDVGNLENSLKIDDDSKLLLEKFDAEKIIDEFDKHINVIDKHVDFKVNVSKKDIYIEKLDKDNNLNEKSDIENYLSDKKKSRDFNDFLEDLDIIKDICSETIDINEVKESNGQDFDVECQNIKFEYKLGDSKKGEENVASVDLNSAIALINRYCGKLPSDTFTRLAPQCWMERVQLPDRHSRMRTAYICTIRMPLNCPVKYNIVGHPMPTRVLARRMAALQACRILHKSGELDDQLMPIGKENFKAAELETNVSCSEPDDSGDSARPGTTKRRQYYFKRTAWAFTDCQPVIDATDSEIEDEPRQDNVADTDSGKGRHNILYAIVSRLWCALPERYNTRGRRLHAPQHAAQAIGVLMARREPTQLQIPAFPVYTRSGEVRVSVEPALQADVRLSPRRARLIRRFMRFVFSDVLRVRRRGMKLQTEGSTHNNYYVVPTIKKTRWDGISWVDIDWSFLELIYRHTEEKKILEVDRPPLWQSDDRRKEKEKDGKVKKIENPLLKPGEVFSFDAEKYKEAVVTPWYRNQDQPQFFLVAEICWKLSPDSAFPSAQHDSFRSYYRAKYGAELTQSAQPLLDVDHTSARLNLLTPRYVNRKGVALPVSSERTRRAKRDRLDQKQILVPELCRVHPFAAPLWFATVALPCVLYRINALLIADEIRRAVAIDVGLGIPRIDDQTCPGFQWPPLDFGWSLAEVLSTDSEKAEKKKEEEEESKQEENEQESSEKEKQEQEQIEADNGEPKEKTINDILQEKLDAENGFEIGTWSNDMAASIPETEYDELLEPLPSNLTFCTSSSGGANWSEPIEKPRRQFNPSHAYSMADSDCSYVSSDFDTDDSDLTDCSDDDTDTTGFCSSRNSNVAMGVRIEYKTAHEAEAVDLERRKPIAPAPQPDKIDDENDLRVYKQLLRDGVPPREYVNNFRKAVAKHKKEIKENGNLIPKDKPIADLLPEPSRDLEKSTYMKINNKEANYMKPIENAIDNLTHEMENVSLNAGLNLEGVPKCIVEERLNFDKSITERINIGKKFSNENLESKNQNFDKETSIEKDSWNDLDGRKDKLHKEDILNCVVTPELSIDNTTFNDKTYQINDKLESQITINHEKHENIGKEINKPNTIDNDEINYKTNMTDDCKIKTKLDTKVSERYREIDKPEIKNSKEHVNTTNKTEKTKIDQDLLKRKIEEIFPYKNGIELQNGQITLESIEKNKRILLAELKKSLPVEEIKKLNCFSMIDIDVDAPEYVNEKVANIGFDSKEKYQEKVNSWSDRNEYKPYYMDSKGQSGKEFDFDYQPDLEGHPGPSPSVILQALTMSNANDGINLERLETIGDSFLKFAITAYLYCAHPAVHEGKLSHMRSKQVSNLNLYRLGRNKRLGARMIASKFEPHDNWLPPCHKPPPTLTPSLAGEKDPPQYPDAPVDSAGCFIPYNLITQHSIPDKSIADCVEALIGAYLLECGPRGALLFMSWLGIRVLPRHALPLPDDHPYVLRADHAAAEQSSTVQKPPAPKPVEPVSSDSCCSDDEEADPELSAPEPDWGWPGRPVGALRPYRDKDGRWMQPIFGELKAPPSPLLRYIEDPEGELEQMLSGYDALERTLQYRFRDRSLLLQALTHASHQKNRLTDCYQRLEFLGDAILDYLITRHLYEDPRRHSPGALTDLRSALVNNTIFATLAARHGFHKYFRHMSPGLNEVLTKYVKIQEENGHSISEEHYLIQEDEMEQAEDVEVPKALGDLFESVAGAIFLDSGMSLGAVWRSVGALLGAELDAFSAAAPKSPVRELLEAEPDTAKFGKPERLADGRRVRVCVEVFGRGAFKGIGRNYRIAKGTAARCALRHLRTRKPR